MCTVASGLAFVPSLASFPFVATQMSAACIENAVKNTTKKVNKECRFFRNIKYILNYKLNSGSPQL
ncbi:hypothetical protein GCM10008015_07580 [Flavobacterium palustre]|uniref:Secreted protein n=1 Tax=Flavobacterium palustre TaxID=1476463 RepID=A0ABQ1HC91_9FLAO|nr:hypothetical protein GCM10008015_07580 [Flavobacterium palustre]